MKTIILFFSLITSLSAFGCDDAEVYADAPRQINKFIKESYPDVRSFKMAWTALHRMHFSFMTNEGQLALGEVGYYEPNCKLIKIAIALRSQEQFIH